MKKISKYLLLFLILILLSLGFFSGCFNFREVVMKRISTHIDDETLTREQLNEDLNILLHNIRDIMPREYYIWPEHTVDSISKSILKNKTLSKSDFLVNVNNLLVSFDIAHLEVSFPKKKYNPHLPYDGTEWPLKLSLSNSNLIVVKADNKHDALKGSRLKKINGASVDSLMTLFLKQCSGTPAWRERSVINNFGQYLFLNKMPPPYKIDFLDSLQKQQTVTITYEDKNQSISASNDNSDDKGFEFNWFNDSIAYINLYSYEYQDIELYSRELDSVFKKIENKCSFLVIDLRYNSGGNSIYGDTLLNHLTDKKYRVPDKKWWMSESYKNNIKQMFPWYMRSIALKMMGVKEYLDSPSNTYYKFDENEGYTYPKQQIHPFRNKVYFVIGSGTFSSAIYTGIVVQDNKIAQLIGQPSGDVANAIGENCYLKLPNSGIVVSIPSACFVRPNRDLNMNAPLIPDILIKSDTLNKYERINICKWLISR
jgi:hypothetical protein